MNMFSRSSILLALAVLAPIILVLQPATFGCTNAKRPQGATPPNADLR